MEGERLLRGLAEEELALLRVPLAVLERVDLVRHGFSCEEPSRESTVKRWKKRHISTLASTRDVGARRDGCPARARRPRGRERARPRREPGGRPVSQRALHP